MNFYPYSNPIILTDDIYEAYGGDITLGTIAQRQAAYWMAEEKASEDLDTLLLKTVITGTYIYTHPYIILDHTYVDRVIVTRFIDYQEDIYYTITGTANVYASIYSQERGVLDIQYALLNCNCHSSSRPSPYKVQVVYEAGFSSGTSFRPDVLMALTTYAQIIMNEIIGYGNEAPGDIGVKDYSNQEYRESRKGLINTTFGSSAKANFAHRMLTRLRKMRYVGL